MFYFDLLCIPEYTLHIREGSGHWLKIPLSPHNPEHKVGGLLAGAPYKLYVTAKNSYGDSGPSDVITFRTEPESEWKLISVELCDKQTHLLKVLVRVAKGGKKQVYSRE